MMKNVLVVLFCSVALLAQSASNHTFDGKTWWEHVKVLADDKLEGRDTGSEGLGKAEAYVVEQLKLNGVEPAGKN